MADEVAIIGAGLSGLTLALALYQQGIRATVYEQRPAPLNIGGAVMLSPNALKVLDALGVYGEIRGKGYNFDLLEMQKPDGELIETYEFGGEDKYGYRALRIYRYELIDAILARVQAAGGEGVSVVFGRKYARVVEETDDRVVWESTDGARSTASWLVGADGIHSTVRKYLYPDLTPKFTGMAGITAGVSAEGVTHLGQKITHPLTIIHPTKGAFVIAPQKVDGSEFLIGKQKSMGELSREEWDRFLNDRDQLTAFLRQDAEEFGPVAVSSTNNIRPDKMNVWPFYVIPELDRWASPQRRVVILGDSAHAIPPSAGQGINQAFEDVYMFALLLAAVKSNKVQFEDALTFWQGYRQGRVNRILELNKQIDLRRMPKGSVISGGEAPPVAKEFDLKWLYEPDFKAEVDDFVKRAAGETA